jgi:ketosteroid isomerase-like protein
MSQENVEVVRRWIDFFNRRDIDGLVSLTEPGFEMKSLLVAIESDARGYAEFPHGYFEQIDEAYEQLQSHPEDFIDAGTAVLVVTHVEWRGRRSGAHGRMPVLAAFWLRDGRVYREETFTDQAEALEAVGLSEQDAHADS